MRLRSITCLCLILSLGACAAAARTVFPLNTDAGQVKAGSYRLDPEHISLLFKTDHLGFSPFYGRFDRVDAVLNLDDENPANSDIAVTVLADSINTRVESLDARLKAPSMFDVARYPEIRFTSTGIERTGDNEAIIHGTLLMAGKTAPLDLQARFVGSGTNPLSRKKTVGFEASGRLKRSDYGLNDWLPLVGDEVELIISAEFVR